MPNRRKPAWSDAYLLYISLFASDLTNDNLGDSFSNKIYRLRGWFYFGFLEISASIIMTTFTSNYTVVLQTLTQNAYFALQDMQSIGPIVSKFHQLLICYAATLLIIGTFNLYIRLTRNHYVNEFSTRLNQFSVSSTKADTFNSYQAQKSINADRQPSQTRDTSKAFYEISQSMIKGPIEITMYLYTLGPTILLVIALFSFMTGYIQKHLAIEERNLRNISKDLQEPANNSNHENHAELSQKLADAYNNERNLGSYSEFAKFQTQYLFQITLLLIFTHFIFLGWYDLAMMSAQSTAAMAAFKRMNQYLSLQKQHTTFSANVAERVSTHLANTVYKSLAPDNQDKALKILDEEAAFIAYEEILTLSREHQPNDIDTLLQKLTDCLNKYQCIYKEDNCEIVRALKNLREKLQLEDKPNHKEVIDDINDITENYTEKSNLLKIYLEDKNKEQENLLIEFQSYNLSILDRLLIISSILLLMLKLSFSIHIPFFTISSTLLSYISTPQVLFSSIVLIFSISAALNYNDVRASNTGSYFLAQIIKTLLAISVVLTSSSLYSIIDLNFICAHSYTLIAIFTSTVPIMFIFEHCFMQSLFFISDVMLTAVSQKAVSLLLKPAISAQKARNVMEGIPKSSGLFNESKSEPAHGNSAVLV